MPSFPLLVPLLLLLVCFPGGTGTAAGPPYEMVVEVACDAKPCLTLGFSYPRDCSPAACEQGVEGEEMAQGYRFFTLWSDAHGGILLQNGTRVFTSLVSFNDRNQPSLTADVYRWLMEDATAPRVDFLLGPYGSSQIEAALTVARQHQRLLVFGGGSSDSLFHNVTHTPSLQLGVTTPTSRYMDSTLRLVHAQGARTIALVHRNQESFYAHLASGTVLHAEQLGMTIEYQFVVHDSAAYRETFARIGKVDVLLVQGFGGHAETIIREWRDVGVQCEAVVVHGANMPALVEELGELADGVISYAQWHHHLNYRDPLFGSATDYASMFCGTVGGGTVPSYHAAGGSAAAYTLQRGLELATDLTEQAVHTAIYGHSPHDCFYGPLQFAGDGSNAGKEMVVTQVQPVGGWLTSVVVGPDHHANRPLVYPVRLQKGSSKSWIVGIVFACLMVIALAFGALHLRRRKSGAGKLPVNNDSPVGSYGSL